MDRDRYILRKGTGSGGVGELGVEGIGGVGGWGNGRWEMGRAVGVETGALGVGTGQWGAESEK